jgi:hypothetical protein
MGRHERGLVGSFPGLGIMTVVACFPGQGEMVDAHAIIKNSCQGNNDNPREVFKYGGFKFVGPRGLSAFSTV